MNFSLTAAFILCCLLGLSLAYPRTSYRGKCKSKSGLECTKYGFYKVKQCQVNSDRCQCVKSGEGTVVSEINKQDDCPPCLLDNAESRKMIAEGMMDVGTSRCAQDGYYDDTRLQCMWHACFCYTRTGEVAKVVNFDELKDEDAYASACKQ